MEALLARNGSSQASQSVVTAGSEQRQRSSQPQDIVSLLARLAVRHDRQIGELTDQTTFAIIIREKTFKEAVLAERRQWQQQRPNEANSLHPSGSSQRVVVWARMLVQLEAGLEQETGHPQTALQFLKSMSPAVVEHSIFRLKPKFNEPHSDEQRPWVWLLSVGVTASQQFREALAFLAAYDKTVHSSMRSRDGSKRAPLKQTLKASALAEEAVVVHGILFAWRGRFWPLGRCWGLGGLHSLTAGPRGGIGCCGCAGRCLAHQRQFSLQCHKHNGHCLFRTRGCCVLPCAFPSYMKLGCFTRGSGLGTEVGVAGLRMAAQALHKFYAPKLHKAAPKAELSSDDRMYVNMGGEITTAAPTGIAGTNVARVQLLQAAPASEPFSSKLQKNHEGYSGVLSLIGSLVADLAKESHEAKVEEDHSQQEYEAFMAESAASRAQKVKEIQESKDARAAVSVSSVKSKQELVSAVTCASETAKVTSALHQSCDWLLQNFDTRQTARAEEIEGLNNAKAVLAGADYSL